MPEPEARIPEVTIQRLPVYLYRLQAMQANGIRSVCSRALAEQLKIPPSRLRRDFHYFGGFSRPGHPYDVDHLIGRLQEILALSGPVDFVIAGLGNLGQAIASYTQFEEDGFRLVGLFDINPRLMGLKFRGIPVQDIESLPGEVKEKQVQLGIITVSPSSAQSVANLMTESGIHGIWNFAPVNLAVPSNVVLHDEFLSVGIMSLCYKVKRMLSENESA